MGAQELSEVGAAGEDRLVTVPNALSLLRLACVPIFVWLLFPHHDRAVAAELLAGLGATDWVDGWIARRYNQVSTLGKVLDPAADRILLITAIVSISVAGAVPVWLALLVGAREVVVSAAVLALAVAGSARIDVVWAGKAGTLAMMVAFPLFLAAHSTMGWHPLAHVLAWVFALPGLVLSYQAAASYLPLARRALVDGRVRSAP